MARVTPKKFIHTKDETEGGFLEVHPGVYVGTVRLRDSKAVLWQCKHAHSRPEYNARYSDDPRQVWEASALNCGRQAHSYWPHPGRGFWGLVEEKNLPVDRRDDMRRATVDNSTFLGHIKLTSKGKRILTVEGEGGITGTIDMDTPGPKGVTPPTIDRATLEKWATAAWLLKGGVWGVVFQDPRVDMNLDKVHENGVRELLGQDFYGPESTSSGGLSIPVTGLGSPAKPSEVSTPKGKPHIRVARNEDGKRVFEVVNGHGQVKGTFVHRGQAAEALAKWSPV